MAMVGALALCGCVTETVVTPQPVGLNGAHVRAAAQAMCASLLQSPALAAKGRAVRVKLSDVDDKSRYMIDGNIFLKRFRAELNKASGGRLLFLRGYRDGTDEERVKLLKDSLERFASL